MTQTWAGDAVAVRISIQEPVVGKRFKVDGTLIRRTGRKKCGRVGRKRGSARNQPFAHIEYREREKREGKGSEIEREWRRGLGHVIHIVTCIRLHSFPPCLSPYLDPETRHQHDEPRL